MWLDKPPYNIEFTASIFTEWSLNPARDTVSVYVIVGPNPSRIWAIDYGKLPIFEENNAKMNFSLAK